MGIRKYTTLQLNSDARVHGTLASPLPKTGNLSDFEYQAEPGFLYVTTRAISSRVNANHDGWPPEELRRAYRTFVGRPVYVDHNNWDLKRSRGVVIDAKQYENKLASGHEDVWVELLIEVDAQAFPKLAQTIIDGDIDSVSMGADVEYTICSVCSNKAHDVLQYCTHIPQMKGRVVETLDQKTGSRIKKLCYEDCYGVSFFEISFVFDPADESALISDVMLASAGNRSLAHLRRSRETIAAYSERLGTSLVKVASIRTSDFCQACGSTDISISKTGANCLDCKFEFTADKVLMSLPQEVDTLRDELNCPQCFTPEALVRTRDGHVPISTIEVGDEVLTESGDFNKVLSVYEHQFSGLLREIETTSTIRPIRMTGEHPLRAMVGYHRKVEGGKEQEERRLDCLPSGSCRHNLKRDAARTHHHLEWVATEDLEKTYVALGFPSVEQEISSVEVPADCFRYASKVPSTIPLNDDFLWIVGLYVAEGSGGKRALSFGLHADEMAYQQRIIDFFSQFGINSRTWERGENGVTVEVYNSVFARWFPQWLGSGSANKSIPEELMTLPLEKVNIVLQGIFDGDGTRSRDLIGQTSPVLALQITEVALRNGGAPTISTQYPEGKKAVYTVNGTTVATLSRTHETKRGTWKFEGTTLSRITRNEAVPYIGPVYNLEVENDPTYVIQNLVVHNCGSEWNGMVCTNCFGPDTLVRTKSGYAPISTIEVGEKVLTESGQYHEVQKVYEHEVHGLVYSLRTSTMTSPVLVTPEHPLRVLVPTTDHQGCLPSFCNKEVGTECPREILNEANRNHILDWKPIQDLKVGDWVSMTLDRSVRDIEVVEVPEPFKGKRERRGLTSFKLTDEFLWVIGLYLAEGCGATRGITFSLHRDEVGYQERVRAFFEAAGYTTSLRFNLDSDSAIVQVNSSTLGEWFPVWLGSGSANKHIPNELITLPNEKLRIIVEGIHDGDGDTKYPRLGQTSEVLALQVMEVSRRLGLQPTMNIEVHDDKKDVYRVTGHVATLERTHKGQRGTWNFQDTPLAQITELELTPYCGPVFNLNVGVDHSYVVQNITTKNCGFELPPEGLGDPNTDPLGLAMPMGKPDGNPQDESEEGGAQGPPAPGAPESGEDDSNQEAKPSKDKSKPKDKGDSEDKGKKKAPPEKAKDDNKKKSGKEDHVVSRFDSFAKEATLPQDPTYRQDTSPANSVPPYGQAIPGGTPLEGFEPALEPAPAAPAVVQDLDAPDVSGPVGQSGVTVVNQPQGPGTTPPPGSQAGEALNSQGQGKAASQQDRKAEFFIARAEALRERADEFEKKAEAVYQTDVRDLDAPPPVDVGADATIDVMKAIEQPEQLLLADTSDVINLGQGTGLPVADTFRERLPQQVNPFNDAALRPYEPVNPQVEASTKEAAKCKAGCECPDGSCNCGPCELSSKHKKSAVEEEATRVAEAKAREDQHIAAAKTKVLRCANFVDERIDLGLSVEAEKYADVARFEEMDDATLDGFIQATREFKAKEIKVAGRRIRVAASEDRGPIRMPSLGSVSRSVVEEDDPADDYAVFL